MRLMRRFTSLLLPVLIAGPAEHAVANDSASVLAAGGLMLVKTDAITIQREDLTLSPREVRVRYEMRNDRSAPITLRVAFPLPELPVDGPGGFDLRGTDGRATAHNIDLPREGRPNFLNFDVWANGHRIAPETEIRAVLPDGRDVTASLREIGGWRLVMRPMLFLDNPVPDQMADNDVGPTIIGRLHALGAIDGDTDGGVALWRTYITFHWQQTFPPGVTIIEHRYEPAVGGFFFRRKHGGWTGGAVGDSEDMERAYCIDSGASHTLQGLIARTPDNLLRASTLAYILTTGANWAGPIGTFNLHVDGRGEDGGAGIVSLCAEMPLQAVGPLQVDGSAENYVPKADLRVLIVRE